MWQYLWVLSRGSWFSSFNILTKSGVKRRRELHLYLNVFMYFKMEKNYIICNKFFLSEKVPDILSVRYYLKWGFFFFGICFSKLYFIHYSAWEKLFFITENIPDGFLTFFCSLWINLPLLTKFIVCKHVPLHFKGPLTLSMKGMKLSKGCLI